METLIYNLTSFFRVTQSQYGKAFGLPATPVALLVNCIFTPPCNTPHLAAIDSRALSILKQ